MFEDIEKFLVENKHPVPNDDKGNRPDEREIAERISKALGGHAKVEVMSQDDAARELGVVDMKKLRAKFNGLADSISYICSQLNIKPFCQDGAGKALAVGDKLKCPSGENKLVMKLGYGFVLLSRTDDHKKEDGWWFENEFKTLKFIKE